MVRLAAALLALLAGCGAADPAAAPAKKRPPPAFPMPPDTRPAGCATEIPDPEGTNFSDFKVSIIIPYRNEKWEHIKGSVESILYFTPKKLLSEILFVSDGNGPETLFLEDLRKLSRLVSVLVLPSPGVGLIEAKMRAVGAAAVRSNVLMFLEPHIRVNRAWLQPLLRRIRLHPNVLAMPALDPIPANDFNGYMPGMAGHWRFEWNLNLIYTNPGEEKVMTSKPYPSPATSGGIFAIRREWWNTLGLYDNGMIGWGGDHIEATFKVWRCGGHIEVVPCSRIGHLFRDPVDRPYDVVVDQVVKNYGRIAKVWFDEYLDSFYKVKGEVKAMDLGDLKESIALREKLQCKDMTWYLDNVDVEMKWEKDVICIPGCDRSKLGEICCELGGPPHGRSTLDRIMPVSMYRTARAEALGMPKDKDEL